MDKTLVFIDAGYLSKISKHFGGGKYIKINYDLLAKTLSKDCNLFCSGVYFYVAPPFQDARPTEDQSNRKASYDKMVHRLKQIPNFHVREGRCQKIDDKYKQKGVDTHLTMDLMKIPSEIKKIILLACDTDFVPIINAIKAEKGINVVLYYYNDKKRGSMFSMSNHIMKACDERILIDKSHFDKSMLKPKEDITKR